MEAPVPSTHEGSTSATCRWHLARSFAPMLQRRVAEAPEPTKGQRNINDFAVTATATRGFATAHVAVTGTDVYGRTADIVALAAQTLTAGQAPTGLLAPAEAFDPAASLADLPVTVRTSF